MDDAELNSKNNSGTDTAGVEEGDVEGENGSEALKEFVCMSQYFAGMLAQLGLQLHLNSMSGFIRVGGEQCLEGITNFIFICK